jgi:hypothetical protein
MNLQLELYLEALEDLLARHLNEGGVITGTNPGIAHQTI